MARSIWRRRPGRSMVRGVTAVQSGTPAARGSAAGAGRDRAAQHGRAAGRIGPRRPVRPRRARPARLGHREVLAALHVLHAGGGAARDPARRPADRGRDRPAGRHRRARPRRARGAVHRRRAADARRPGRDHRALARRRRPASTSRSRPTASASTTASTRSSTAGLTRVNVSLDTVDREHFARLTRRDRLPAVLAGIARGPRRRADAAQDERRADARHARRRARPARLGARERLPPALHRADAARRRRRPGCATTWSPAAELLDVLGDAVHARRGRPRRPVGAGRGVASVDGGPATVGIIASVTRSFCAACDRTRITAEGTVRSCLFGDDETDLRGLLRGGADDAEIAALVARRDVGQAGRARDGRGRVRAARCAAWGRSVAEVLVRYFAAAAEAAGREPRSASTVADADRRRPAGASSSRATASRWSAWSASGSFLVDGDRVAATRRATLGGTRRRAAALRRRLTRARRVVSRLSESRASGELMSRLAGWARGAGQAG